MWFSRQEYQSGLLLPSPGDLPNPGIEPRSPTLQADTLPSEPPGKLGCMYHLACMYILHVSQANCMLERSTGSLSGPWLFMNGMKVTHEIICKTSASWKLLNVPDVYGEKSWRLITGKWFGEKKKPVTRVVSPNSFFFFWGRFGVYLLQFLGASVQCKKNKQTKRNWNNNYNFFKNPVNNFQSFLYILTKLFFKTNTK